MNALMGSGDKSEAAILSEIYRARRDAEIKARTGTKADKAYFRSVDQIYANAVSGLGISKQSDPAVYMEARDAIAREEVTNERDLKAKYPNLAFRDMERLKGVLGSLQKADMAEVKAAFDAAADSWLADADSRTYKKKYGLDKATLWAQFRMRAATADSDKSRAKLDEEVRAFFKDTVLRKKVFGDHETGPAFLVPHVIGSEDYDVDAPTGAARKQVVDYLTANGLAVTDENIMAAYRQAIRQGAGLR